MLGAQLNKRNRSFSMGKSLVVTGIVIDSDRVIELEVSERLDNINQNWDKLCYAEQFIHVWMSGAISVIRKPQHWLRCDDCISDRFLAFLNLVKKWSGDVSAENTCFYDYAEALLE